LFSNHLCHNGFRAIAPEGREHGHRNATRRPYANTHTFGSRCQTRRRCRIMEPELGCTVGAALLARSQANTNVASLLTCPRLLLAPMLKIGMLEGYIQHTGVIPTIVDVARRNFVR